MNTNDMQSQLGRKIWYGLAITLSALVILVSAAALVGTWISGNTMSAATTQALLVVEGSAHNLIFIVDGIDMRVAELEETTFTIRDATDQLSQNVTDKGLVLTLLPEERENRLVSQAQELQQNINSVGNTLRAGLELYQSIDSLPFISLPRPEQQTVNQLEQNIAEIQDSVQEVILDIQAFRDGVSDNINRVTGLLEGITTRLTGTRKTLEQLNARLQALQDLAAGMQSKVTLVFTSLSAVVSILLVWVIYTQVEIIRSYAQRWKSLENATVEVLPVKEAIGADSPDVTDQEVEVTDVSD